MVLPFHRQIEEALDQSPKTLNYGSTKRGIAQAYQFKAAKVGLQVGELLADEATLRARLEPAVEFANIFFRGLEAPETTVDVTLDYLRPFISKMQPYIANALPQRSVNSSRGGKQILVEGQLGTPARLWTGGSIPTRLPRIPWPDLRRLGQASRRRRSPRSLGLSRHTALASEKALSLPNYSAIWPTRFREVGKEFGAATGRPRRIGWFDVVATSAWCPDSRGRPRSA